MIQTCKKLYKEIDIYYIGYFTIKKFDDFEFIYSVNPLHLIINSATGYQKKKKDKRRKILNSWFDRQIWRSLVWN